MRLIHESGLQKREVNRIYMKKPVCHSKGSNFGSVGMIDCSGAFLIFGAGLLLSGIIFLIEHLAKIYQRKSNRMVELNEEHKERKDISESIEKDLVLYEFVN